MALSILRLKPQALADNHRSVNLQAALSTTAQTPSTGLRESPSASRSPSMAVPQKVAKESSAASSVAAAVTQRISNTPSTEAPVAAAREANEPGHPAERVQPAEPEAAVPASASEPAAPEVAPSVAPAGAPLEARLRSASVTRGTARFQTGVLQLLCPFQRSSATRPAARTAIELPAQLRNPCTGQPGPCASRLPPQCGLRRCKSGCGLPYPRPHACHVVPTALQM